MTKDEILRRTKKVLGEQLSLDENAIYLENSLVDDLGADELDTVQFIMAAEEEFGITIPEEDVEHLHTVSEYVDYFERKVNESHAG